MEPEKKRVFWFARIFGFALSAFCVWLAATMARNGTTLWGQPAAPAYVYFQVALLLFVAVFFVVQTLRNT